MLDQKQVLSHWPEIKNQVLSRWTKLIEPDVDETQDNINLLRKLVHKKYGLAEEFNMKLEDICDSCVMEGPGESLAMRKSAELESNKGKDKTDPEILFADTPTAFNNTYDPEHKFRERKLGAHYSPEHVSQETEHKQSIPGLGHGSGVA